MDIINGKINGKRIKWKINKNNLLNIIIIILMSIYHTDGIRINNSNNKLLQSVNLVQV
jgi:hypothetical protein